jgi:hypothetical protein
MDTTTCAKYLVEQTLLRSQQAISKSFVQTETNSTSAEDHVDLERRILESKYILGAYGVDWESKKENAWCHSEPVRLELDDAALRCRVASYSRRRLCDNCIFVCDYEVV